jgi:hypothetical protein
MPPSFRCTRRDAEGHGDLSGGEPGRAVRLARRPLPGGQRGDGVPDPAHYAGSDSGIRPDLPSPGSAMAPVPGSAPGGKDDRSPLAASRRHTPGAIPVSRAPDRPPCTTASCVTSSARSASPGNRVHAACATGNTASRARRTRSCRQLRPPRPGPGYPSSSHQQVIPNAPAVTRHDHPCPGQPRTRHPRRPWGSEYSPPATPPDSVLTTTPAARRTPAPPPAVRWKPAAPAARPPAPGTDGAFPAPAVRKTCPPPPGRRPMSAA